MGSNGTLDDRRLRSTSARSESDGAKIMKFDPARRTSRKPISPRGFQRLKRREHPQRITLAALLLRGIRNLINFLFGSSRGGRRPSSRGTQRSGKRRA